MSTNETVQQIGKPAWESAEQKNQPQAGLRDTAHTAGEKIREKTSATAEQLKEKSSEALHQVREHATEIVNQQKDTLLEQLSHCSHASRRAAESLREDNAPRMADMAESLAGQIDRTAEYFRNHEYTVMMRDVEDFARRRPEVFFGGLFIAGLAMARFLKASSTSRREEELYETFGRTDDTLEDEDLGGVHETHEPAGFESHQESAASAPSGTIADSGCGCGCEVEENRPSPAPSTLPKPGGSPFET